MWNQLSGWRLGGHSLIRRVPTFQQIPQPARYAEYMTTTRTCGHCGQICGDYVGGYGGVSYGGGPVVHLCHPNDPARPDCYRRVTVWNEALGTLLDVWPKPSGIEGMPGRQAIIADLAALGRRISGGR